MSDDRRKETDRPPATPTLLVLVAIGSALLGAIAMLAWQGNARFSDGGPADESTFGIPGEDEPEPDPEAEAAAARQRAATRPAPVVANVPPVTFSDGTVARLMNVQSFEGPQGVRAMLTQEDRDRLSKSETLKQIIVCDIDFARARSIGDREHAVRINGRLVYPWTSGPLMGLGFARRAPAATVVDLDAGEIVVDVALATGPYVSVQRFAWGDRNDRSGDPTTRPMRISGMIDRGKSVLLLIEDEAQDFRRFASQAWRLEAVRHDGTRVAANSAMSGGSTGFLIGIPVDPRDVACVEYGYRDYEWHSLGSIKVPPPTTVPANAKSMPMIPPIVMPTGPKVPATRGATLPVAPQP